VSKLLIAGAVIVATLTAQGNGGERLKDTSTLVAGRPAQVVSSVYFESSGACGARALGSSVDVTLAPPRGLSVSTPLTRHVAVHAGVVTARWHVRAARAFVRTGTVTWKAAGRDGRDCSTVTSLEVVAAAAPPTLVVTGAVRYKDGVAVLLRARLPGVRRFGREFPNPFEAVFTEHHDRDVIFAETGRDLYDIFSVPGVPSNRLISFHFDARGVACMHVRTTARPASLGYRLSFAWNHELGARSIRRSGSVPVLSRGHTPAEERCAGAPDVLQGGPGDAAG
jgi:hypothetical protein